MTRAAFTPRLVLEFDDPRVHTGGVVRYRLIALEPHKYVVERAETDALGGTRWERVGGEVTPDTAAHKLDERTALLAMAIDTVSTQVAIKVADWLDRVTVAEDRAGNTDAAMTLRAAAIALRTGHWKEQT